MHGPAGGGGKNWLLIKGRDNFSREKDILAEAPRSVKTKRSIEEIAGDRDDVWDSKSGGAANVKGAHKAKMATKLVPQLAVLAEHPPEGDQWVHEIKFDGYRLLAFIKDGAVTLRTRTGEDGRKNFCRWRRHGKISGGLGDSGWRGEWCLIRRGRRFSGVAADVQIAGESESALFFF